MPVFSSGLLNDSDLGFPLLQFLARNRIPSQGGGEKQGRSITKFLKRTEEMFAHFLTRFYLVI